MKFRYQSLIKALAIFLVLLLALSIGNLYSADSHPTLIKAKEHLSGSSAVSAVDTVTTGNRMSGREHLVQGKPEEPLVCADIVLTVPPDVIEQALQEPERIQGWGELQDPTTSFDPTDNPYRLSLTLQKLEEPYHPTNNSLIFESNCPGGQLNLFHVSMDVSGTVNDAPITGRGVGMADANRGFAEIEWSFTAMPPRFHPLCSAMSRTLSLTAAIAREVDGAVNLLTLADGNYQARSTKTAEDGKQVYIDITISRTGSRFSVKYVFSGEADCVDIVDVGVRGDLVWLPVAPGQFRETAQIEMVTDAGEIHTIEDITDYSFDPATALLQAQERKMVMGFEPLTEDERNWIATYESTVVPGSATAWGEPGGVIGPPFTTFQDNNRGSVEFYKDEETGAFSLGVFAVFPNPPLVTHKFIESHSIAAVFLALAPLDAKIPDEILNDPGLNRSATDWSDDRETRESLKAELDTQIASFPKYTGQSAQSCSPNFRAWANDVYGGATCGLANVVVNDAFATAHYCPPGVNGCQYDINFQLGCQSALNHCGSYQQFSANYTNTNWRHVELHGPAEWAKSGFHSHFGAANCQGDGGHGGDLRFRRRYGNGNWLTLWVPEGGMHHIYHGVSLQNYGPGFGLSYGHWHNHTPPQATHRMRIDYNSASGDQAVLCGDVHNDVSFSAPPSFFCGGCSWCLSSSSCNGCFRSPPGGGAACSQQ